MPRHDDRAGPTRLYVGHLSSRTRSRDLESLFNKYGRVLDVDMKHDFAFIDFSDSRDADDARHYLNGRNVEGNRIVVEFARRGPRGASGSRDYMGRGPPPGTGRCYNCGNDGHWARDCKAGDWKNKCYRCGERGHIERNCHSSPRPNKSRSRSRSRSAEPRHHSRSRSRSYSRGRSYSRSPRKGNGSASVLEEHPRPRSASRSQSPMSNAKSPTPFSPAANGESLGGSPPLGRDLSVSQSPHKAEAMDDPISPYRDERSPSK